MDYKTLLHPSIEATHTPTMSNQTDHLSSATAASQNTSSPEHRPLASALTFFSTSGPSGDWIKYFVIMGLLELIRRSLIFAWTGLVNQFWITIALEEYGDSHCESGLSLCHLVADLMKSRFRSLDDGMAI